VLGNLFGTPRRVALGMGADNVEALREVGKVAGVSEGTRAAKGLRDAWEKLPVFKESVGHGAEEDQPATVPGAGDRGPDVDLSRLPIQTCWPEDAGALITWGLVVTRGPNKPRQNLGIYRQQVIAATRSSCAGCRTGAGRWISRMRQARPGEPFPVVVALGADPATILAAVTPVPDTLSEYAFAGLLRGSRTELAQCLGNDLQAPASAEFVLEGHYSAR